MKNMVYGFFLSLQFLTRLPIRYSFDVNDHSMRWAVRFFPVVGYIIGLFLVLPFCLLQSVVPENILALLTISLWVYITGGLHMDGWMDVADAVGSNAKLSKKYEIMKDSRVGSFAVLAVLLLLVWKAALMYELFLNINHLEVVLFLFIIPAISRFQALLQLAFIPSFQNKGMAYTWQQHMTKKEITISFCFFIPVIIAKPEILLLLLGQLLFSFLFGRWAIKQFKGINGDLVGASIEGAELWNLSLVYIYTLFVMA